MDQQNNPYRAPEAAIVDYRHVAELAGRGERLAAAIIDTVIMLAILLPVMFFGGYFSKVMDTATGGQPMSLMAELAWGLVSLLVFFAIQSYPLYATAQTWGKRVLKMRIVGLDGQRLSFGRLIALRYLSMQGVGLVPLIGPLLSIVNVLLIFRADHRCGHDLIAGTKVVKA
jgi:uncharacterized RDD family membrane protein YckC